MAAVYSDYQTQCRAQFQSLKHSLKLLPCWQGETIASPQRLEMAHRIASHWDIITTASQLVNEARRVATSRGDHVGTAVLSSTVDIVSCVQTKNVGVEYCICTALSGHLTRCQGGPRTEQLPAPNVGHDRFQSQKKRPRGQSTWNNNVCARIELGVKGDIKIPDTSGPCGISGIT
jgi:hypothetical protein